MANFSEIYVPAYLKSVNECKAWIFKNMINNEEVFDIDIVNGKLTIWEDQNNNDHRPEWREESFDLSGRFGNGTKHLVRMQFLG